MRLGCPRDEYIDEIGGTSGTNHVRPKSCGPFCAGPINRQNAVRVSPKEPREDRSQPLPASSGRREPQPKLQLVYYQGRQPQISPVEPERR